MEPKFEQPKQYTREQIAEMEKSRTISDVELLKGGAEYSINDEGAKENLLATEKQKDFLENKRLQDTMSILENTFGINDLKSRDKKMRYVTMENIEAIIFSADKELYATYNEYGNFRLWSAKPKIQSDGHVDWSTNWDIALAQAGETVSLNGIRKLEERFHATQDDEDAVGTTLLIVIPKQ